MIECEGTKTVTLKSHAPTTDPYLAVMTFREKHGQLPECVTEYDRDGDVTRTWTVHGACEGCRKAILDGDRYVVVGSTVGEDSDLQLCPECAPKDVPPEAFWVAG